MDKFLKRKGPANESNCNSDSEPGPSSSSNSKSKRRMCYFNEKWTVTYKWIKKEDAQTAYCKACNVRFTVKYNGEKAVKAHENSNNHIKYTNAVKKSDALSNFFAQKNSPESLEVAAVEISSVYHSIMHQHSYLSSDCGTKLYSVFFKDSNIAKKIRCGRTKSEAIAENVLLPLSIEMAVSDLKTQTQSPSSRYDSFYFTLATDASNKGTRKMFPVLVRYFSYKQGLQEKLIDFFKQPDESAESITSCLLNTLKN